MRAGLLSAGVALAFALACGGPAAEAPAGTAGEGPGSAATAAPAPEPAARPSARSLERAAGPAVSAAPPAAPAALPQKPPPRSLDDLSRIPEGKTFGDPIGERLVARERREAQAARKAAARVAADVRSQRDEAILAPGEYRERTDVEVSVGSEKSRLRGGVRMEGESSADPRNPIPTVGVERRF